MKSIIRRIGTSLFLSTLFLWAFFLAAASTAYAGPFDSCDYSIAVSDGHLGFVWKPTGAHRSQAVLVLPGRFKGYVGNSHTLTVRTVAIYRSSDDKKIGTMPMKSNGICPGGGECLDRPSFAHPTLSGAALARRYGKIRLRVTSNVENHIHCTSSFNPKNRQD